MAPNSTITELVATTLAKRSGKIADNVSNNNALLSRLKQKGRIQPVSGGRSIYQEFAYRENSNGGWYSGYDTLPVAAADVMSGAEFDWKQYAVAVVMSGLEEIQNDGDAQVHDLLAERIGVAESTMANDISDGLYSDGTGSGSKQITGLDAAVPQDPTTGTYGGINRATAGNEFWRSQLYDPSSTPTSTTIQGYMNLLWSYCNRGADRPDLIMSGGTIWATFMASMQTLQRFTDPDSAKLGFPSIKFMDADVVLDGGIGGEATATDMYFLNTKYIHFRPSRKRNMVPIGGERLSTNQDAKVTFLAWAGNLTTSGAKFQGRLKGD